MDYLYKTTPYAHQDKIFRLSRDRDYYALLTGTGTGKSKIALDTAAWMFIKGKIDALVIVAPNDVHRKWIVKEVPAHLPDYVARTSGYWRAAGKASEKRAYDEAAWKLHETPVLRVLAFNIEVCSNKRGSAEIMTLLNTYRCLLVVDEAHRMKTPNAERTKTLYRMSQKTPYKRILTGSLVLNEPIDLFAPMRFLSPTITGHTTFTGFKSDYAIIERRRTTKNDRGYYDEIVGFNNLDALAERVSRHAYIINVEECVDMPRKIHEVIPVTPSAEQNRIMTELVAQGAAVVGATIENMEDLWAHVWDGESGVVVSQSALTLLLRMQQVAGGTTADSNGKVWRLKEQPKLRLLKDILQDLRTKVIIWSHFRDEIEMICDMLAEEFGEDSFVAYHGGVDKDTRAEALDRMDDDERTRFFVGQPRSGGIGLDINAAPVSVRYSRSFSLEDEIQSAGRNYRIGQEADRVVYIDLVMEGTVDEKIAEAVQHKEAQANEFYNLIRSKQE